MPSSPPPRKGPARAVSEKELAGANTIMYSCVDDGARTNSSVLYGESKLVPIERPARTPPSWTELKPMAAAMRDQERQAQV